MGNNRRRGKRINDDDRPGSWVAYGKLLKFFRTKAGLTQEELAERMGYSQDHCASVEQGRRPAKGEFTERAEEVTGAGGVLTELQEEVDRAQLPAFFQDFATLEADAVSRLSYDPMLIPGLLQTEEYARALISVNCPPLADETMDQHVTARLARQALLTRQKPPVAFIFIIEEATLHRRIGGREVLQRQLRKLVEHAKLRNVEIQILPTAAAAHCGLDGHMVLLEGADRKQIVCLESQGRVIATSSGDAVSDYRHRYGSLLTKALDTERSIRLIEQVARDL